jgi:hypothetical protein
LPVEEVEEEHPEDGDPANRIEFGHVRAEDSGGHVGQLSGFWVLGHEIVH